MSAEPTDIPEFSDSDVSEDASEMQHNGTFRSLNERSRLVQRDSSPLSTDAHHDVLHEDEVLRHRLSPHLGRVPATGLPPATTLVPLQRLCMASVDQFDVFPVPTTESTAAFAAPTQPVSTEASPIAMPNSFSLGVQSHRDAEIPSPPPALDQIPSAHPHRFRACRLRRLYTPTASLLSDDSSAEKNPSSSSPSWAESSSSSLESSATEAELTDDNDADDDDDDSDWGPRKRHSSRRVTKKQGQRKGQVVKRSSVGRPRRHTSTVPSADSDNDSLSWPKVPPRRLGSQKRGRRNLRFLRDDDDDDDDDEFDHLYDNGGGSTPESSSYYRRSRKRHRSDLKTPSTDFLPLRVSARRANRQQLNYAELFQDDSDSESSTDDVSLSAAGPPPEATSADPVHGIDRVLGYRLRGSPEDTEASVIPLPLKDDGTEPGIHDVEFFVKWLRTSHLHNTWSTYENIQQQGASGLRKLENFYRKLQILRFERLHMTEDEIEQQDIASELQKQIDADCLIAERLVSHRVDQVSSLTTQAAPPITASDVSRNQSPRPEAVSVPAQVPPLSAIADTAEVVQTIHDTPTASVNADVAFSAAIGVKSNDLAADQGCKKREDHCESPVTLSAIGESNTNSTGGAPTPSMPSEISSVDTPLLSDLVQKVEPKVEHVAVAATTLSVSSPTSTVVSNGLAATECSDTLNPQDWTDSGDALGHQHTLPAENVVDMYFVKWTNAPYDQCTWETAATLEKHGFKPLIDAYWERESRIVGAASTQHPLHSHLLSRTSFEPYQETPFYMNRVKAGDLRDYQLTGLNWMISRMKKGLSVLLADEMGLGKTVQAISLIGHMMFAEMIAGPYLVIVPQSTADNWLSEFQRWLPLANVVVYHGNPQSRDILREHELCRVRARPYALRRPNLSAKAVGHRILPTTTRRVRYRFDVCISTPSILNNSDDLDLLRSVDWYFMAIDEAHLLKNRESRRFRELNWFKTRYRLLLSGTPLHNNLEELWSLLHFLCPRLYEELDNFKQRFSEIERTDSVGDLKEKQLATLQAELHELVLRRVKKDVETSLPKKIERILRVELSPQQSQCCKAIIARNYEVLAKSTGTSKASLQNICMELKKACNHPLLLQSDFDIATLQSNAAVSVARRQEWHQALLYSSGKLALLDKLLPYLKDKQHRVLIFSQMVRMLNILSSYLTLRGYKHQRLDGTMSREVRKKAMDHFNSPDSDDFCFLLSTKAGGLGINLTTADTVIIYDSDWNPQNDLQAEARAHRIGQTKVVQIYRLVTKDTIEERILERAKTKMVLDTLVVQGLNKKSAHDLKLTDRSAMEDIKQITTKGASGFSKEELSKILKFGACKLWQSTVATTASTDQDTSSCKDAEDDSLTPRHAVDLEKILAEAEEHSTGEEGLADQLLSSFTNISDFRYEAPPDPPEYEDKQFWEKAIPLEDRENFSKETKTLILLGSKRHRKQVKRTGVIPMDDFADDHPEKHSSNRGGKRTSTGVTASISASQDDGSKHSARHHDPENRRRPRSSKSTTDSVKKPTRITDGTCNPKDKGHPLTKTKCEARRRNRTAVRSDDSAVTDTDDSPHTSSRPRVAIPAKRASRKKASSTVLNDSSSEDSFSSQPNHRQRTEVISRTHKLKLDHENTATMNGSRMSASRVFSDATDSAPRSADAMDHTQKSDTPPSTTSGTKRRPLRHRFSGENNQDKPNRKATRGAGENMKTDTTDLVAAEPNRVIKRSLYSQSVSTKPKRGASTKRSSTTATGPPPSRRPSPSTTTRSSKKIVKPTSGTNSRSSIDNASSSIIEPPQSPDPNRIPRRTASTRCTTSVAPTLPTNVTKNCV